MPLPPPKQTRQLNAKSLLFGITTQRAFRISQDGGVIFLEEIGTWSYTRLEQSAQQQLWRSIIRPGQRHAPPIRRNKRHRRNKRRCTVETNATAPPKKAPPHRNSESHPSTNSSANTTSPRPCADKLFIVSGPDTTIRRYTTR